MTGYIYLEIAIAVIFTILVFALIATSIQEVIAGMLRWRSAALRQGVRRLLGKAFDDFWKSPLIESLRGPQIGFFRVSGNRDPSAIDPKIFSKALLSELGLAGMSPQEIAAHLEQRLTSANAALNEFKSLESLSAAIESARGDTSKIKAEIEKSALPDPLRSGLLDIAGIASKVVEKLGDEITANAKRLEEFDAKRLIEDRLGAILASVKGDAEKAEEAIAEWFDTSMNRVSGWYVRRAQKMLFIIGLSLAAITNTDIVTYAQFLRDNDAARQAVVTRAAQIAALEELDDVQDVLLGKAPDGTPNAPISPDKGKEQIQALVTTLTQELETYKVRTGWSHCGKVIETDASGTATTKVPEGKFSWPCFLVTTGIKDTVAQEDEGKTTRQTYVLTGKNDGRTTTYVAQIDSKGEPIGATSPVFSWILLAFGVMLGSQFWFDLLKKFVALRSAGADFLKKGTGPTGTA